jgi:DNA-binding NarL/FixJ family response regulator
LISMHLPGDTREQTVFPAAQGKDERRAFVTIECPFPLLTVGLVEAIEGAQLRHRQGPMQPDAPHIVVLWAEDPEELANDVERLRKGNPEASVLVLGLRKDMHLASAAVRAGARGYVHAGMTPEQIARALSVAASGEMVAPRELLEYLVSEPSDEGLAERLGSLKPRQRQILGLLATGLTNSEIAGRLYLSEATVKGHLRWAYKVLGVKNRTEAARVVRNVNEH